MKLKKEALFKIIKIVLVIGIGIFSFFNLSDKHSNPAAYEKYISVLDEKKANVMGLTASASAASVAITAIPDDIGTPIANQLADLSSYLLIILTVIYLEKYLLSIIGLVVFKIIIPAACMLYLLYIISPDNFSLKKASLKFFTFGVAIMLLIPSSVTVSRMIDETYQESINETLKVTNEEIAITENVEQNESKTELKWYEKIYYKFVDVVDDVKDAVKTSTTEAVTKAKTMLSNFIEATAVMIVTSCIVPLLTVAAFIWMTKIILGIEIEKPDLIELKDKLKLKNGQAIIASRGKSE